MQSEPWRSVRLGHVASIKHGWPFKSEHFCEELTGEPIVVAIGNFEYTGGFRFEATAVKEYRADYPREYELAAGDILVVMTCQTPGGEILGIPARVPDDGRTYLHNQRTGKVVITRPDLVSADYLYWVFLSAELNQELVASSSGTKIVHTAPSRIEAVRLSLPPLDEQRAIAKLLWALENKRQLNRRMNRTLEATAAALFRSWFVDFEPVVAKAEGRRTAEVPEAVHAAMPAFFTNIDEVTLPSGWRPGTLGAVAELHRNQLAPSAIAPGTVYIAMEHMPRRSIALDAWDTIEHVDSAKSCFERGDVLFGKLRPYFHKVGIAPTDGVCSTEILVLRPRAPEWYGLLVCLASSTDLVDYASAAAEGTRMPRVSWSYLEQYPISLPTADVAGAFTALVHPLFDRILANVHESRSLAALRDTLLPQLLSGAIRLHDAERAVAAAV